MKGLSNEVIWLINSGLEVFIVAFFSILVIVFFELLFSKGMLLEWYVKGLLEIYRELIDEGKTFQARMLKPLGLCVYCYGSWVFIFMYIILLEKITIFILPGLGLNYLFIKIYDSIHSKIKQDEFISVDDV